MEREPLTLKGSTFFRWDLISNKGNANFPPRRKLGLEETCVLFFDRLDDALLEGRSTEDIYLQMTRVLNKVNDGRVDDEEEDDDDDFSSINDSKTKKQKVPCRYDPICSTSATSVVFGNYEQGWGFTIDHFAADYAVKFGVPQDKMQQKLWGDWHFDCSRKVWTRSSHGGLLERSVCQFIFKPVQTLARTAVQKPAKRNDANLSKMLNAINVHIPECALHSGGGQELVQLIMRSWLPLESGSKKDGTTEEGMEGANDIHADDDCTVTTTASTQCSSSPSSDNSLTVGSRTRRRGLAGFGSQWFKK